jgi:transcriptional antiterminator NusG
MAGLVTYVPHEIYWTTRTRARQTLKVERCKPLFPRYVFISGAINWYAIAQIEEVAGVMALAGVPRKVPTSELADLARREREGRFDERRRAVLDLAESGPLYQRGDMIRVTGANNPFQGLDVLVDGDSNDDKVKVLVSIFGRETPMVLPLSEINMLQAVSRGIESGAVA